MQQIELSLCTTEAPVLIAHLANKGLDEAHPGVPDWLVGAGIGAALHRSVGAGDRAIGVPRVCMHTTTIASLAMQIYCLRPSRI